MNRDILQLVFGLLQTETILTIRITEVAWKVICWALQGSPCVRMLYVHPCICFVLTLFTYFQSESADGQTRFGVCEVVCYDLKLLTELCPSLCWNSSCYYVSARGITLPCDRAAVA